MNPKTAQELLDNATQGDWVFVELARSGVLITHGICLVAGIPTVMADGMEGYTKGDAKLIASAKEITKAYIEQGEENKRLHEGWQHQNQRGLEQALEHDELRREITRLKKRLAETGERV